MNQNIVQVIDDNIVQIIAPGPQGPQGAAGVGIIDGGTTGQVLAKVSDTDYDTAWTDVEVSRKTLFMMMGA